MRKTKKYQWVSQKEGEPIMENGLVFDNEEDCFKDMVDNIFIRARNVVDADSSYMHLEFRGSIAWLNGVKFTIEEI